MVRPVEKLLETKKEGRFSTGKVIVHNEAIITKLTLVVRVYLRKKKMPYQNYTYQK